MDAGRRGGPEVAAFGAPAAASEAAAGGGGREGAAAAARAFFAAGLRGARLAFTAAAIRTALSAFRERKGQSDKHPSVGPHKCQVGQAFGPAAAHAAQQVAASVAQLGAGLSPMHCVSPRSFGNAAASQVLLGLGGQTCGRNGKLFAGRSLAGYMEKGNGIFM